MNIFSYATIRHIIWSLIIFYLHLTNSFTVISFFVVSLSLMLANYFFEKTGRERQFENKILEWLWLPISAGTMIFVLYHYVF